MMRGLCECCGGPLDVRTDLRCPACAKHAGPGTTYYSKHGKLCPFDVSRGGQARRAALAKETR